MRRLALALSLTLAAQALGASALDSSREQATGAHHQVEALSLEQSQRRAELDALSRRIEALKAARERTAGAELEADLRRSQALSDALAALSRSLSQATRAAQVSDEALLGALNAALFDAQRAWPQADAAGRTRILTTLRALRSERETVRARLPRTQAPTVAPAQTDDPTALLEQADALRDSEDKVRRQLAALEARISETRSERELDRRMNELAGEDSLFDEQDRQLRLTRGADGQLAVDAPQAPERAGYTASPPPTTTPTSNGPGTVLDGQPAPVEVHATDHQPQLGGGLAPLSADDELAALEAERAELTRRAAALEARAQAAEQKARAAP
jgi:hypothetical protein